MSNSSLATELELDASYEGAVPGDSVSNECLEEIVRRIRISARKDVSIPADVDVSDDSENLLTKQTDGTLRVQKDTFCSETQDIPVPSPSVSEGTRYIVPIADRCISSVILKTGVVVEIPNKGQTLDDDGGTPGDPSDDTYTYPASLLEFSENLDGETAQFDWSVEGGQLIVESTLDEEVAAVMECENPADGDAQTYREVTAIIEEQAGDVEVIFQKCAVENGIDYSSQFMRAIRIAPGDGYDRAYETQVATDKTTWKIEGVTKALEVTLQVFTPASRESSADF